jgi:hypothetical protein
MTQDKEHQNVVGNCPTCGAPIYAGEAVSNEAAPVNTYSCRCRLHKLNQGGGHGGAPMVKYGSQKSVPTDATVLS